MNIFLVNQDNPHAKTLMVKLAEQVRPNAIILLTTEEMDLYESDDFKSVYIGTDGDSRIVELTPGDSYVFLCDNDTNIDDIIKTGKRLNIRYSVVRTGRIDDR